MATPAEVASLPSVVPKESMRSPSNTVPQLSPLIQDGSKQEHEQAEGECSLQPLAALDRRLSHARRALVAKKEARQKRRNLIQSGDYLGVQGINPDTGQLDVLTPSESERSSISDDTLHRISTVRRTLRDAKASYKDVASWTEREMNKILVSKEQDKLKRLEKEKAKLKAIGRGVQWRRHTKQWSSVHEPNLSPIAQSHTSNNTTRESVPHPTLNMYNLTEAGRTSHQIPLVDVTFASPRNSKSPPSGQDGDSQDSSGTTIRTPHRLSLADPSPSALELFENGIRFDYQNNSFVPQRAGPNTEKQSTEDFEAPSPTSQPRNAAITGKESFIPENLSSEVPPTVSVAYEDLRYPPKARPRDIQNQLTIKRSMQKPLQDIEWTSQLLRERNLSDGPLEKLRHVSYPDKFLGENRKTKKDGTTHCPPFQHLEGNAVEAHSLLLTSDPKDLKRAKTPMHPDGSKKATRRALHSMTNLRNRKPPKELGKKKKEAPLANALKAKTKSQIRRDMLHLRSQVEKLNQNKSPVEEPANRDICVTDHQWIEETVRSITEKGMQVMAESVSTPIITTTGCVPATSPSNQPEDLLIARLNAVPKKRPLSHVLYNLPEKKMRTTCQNDNIEMPLNLSVKDGVIPSSEANAITSTSHLAVTKQRSHTVARRTRPKRLNNWPMNEKSQGPLSKAVYSQSSSMENATGSRAAAQREDLELERKNASVAAQQKHAPRDISWKNQQQEKRDVIPECHQSQRAKEQPLLPATFPGSYPVPLAEDDVTELHSEAIESNCKVTYNILTPLRMVYVYAIPLFGMYWEIVGPVFDARSKYWHRSAHRESTFIDGLTVLLALPGAIIGMLCLV